MPRSHSSPVRRFSWDRNYRAAVLETDIIRLENLISEAECSLMARFLTLTNREEDEQEIQAVEAALRAIHRLKQERLRTKIDEVPNFTSE